MAELDKVATQAQMGYRKVPRLVSVGTPLAPPLTLPTASDQQFMDMLKAYRHSGGLLRAPDVAARCRPHSGTDVHTLAGWVLHRQVLSFEWLSRIWLPVFQFQRADMSRQSGLAEVLAELVGLYDDWQVASWFARPNRWLQDALPADQMATAAADVIAAARAERFLPTVQLAVCC
ncbi:hypothetical protein [Rhodoferax sp. U11-2br]|uniref:hypothetical protein n=1 Tax=Rhodoferax sp. U11-2br TaxID=2838878 RepID=UPI001BEAC928|nr:hypothetical protein [Rhodoferax sp. U11-2br]MBT3067489.1 hypothetical protein [Rhodoferax sp. U11-2br]